MKKGVLIIGILFLAITLPLVSSFFHKKVQESPVDVGVTVANAAPTILDFFSVIENPDDLGTIPGTIQGITGTTVTVKFNFTASDPNGVADLPGLTGPAIVEGTNVIVTFTEPANDLTAGINTVSAIGGNCIAVSCVGNPDCADQTAGTTEKEYICNIDMNYYDPPSPGAAAGDRWTISVTILDSSSVTDTKSSGDVGFATLVDNYIIYQTITGIDTSGSVNWASLDTAIDDQIADSGLTLTNLGNVEIADEEVTGRNLVENLLPANFIGVDAFSAGVAIGGSNIGACDAPTGGGSGTAGIRLADGPPGVIVTVPVSYTAAPGSTSTMFFCVWDNLNNGHISGAPALNYVADLTNGNRWVIIFNS